MPKLLMCLLSVVLLGSKSCSSKALGDFVNLLKTSDKVELFAVEAFPTAAQEQTLDATYVADYKVSEFIPTDPAEATALTLDRKSTRLNSSHSTLSRMPSSA